MEHHLFERKMVIQRAIFHFHDISWECRFPLMSCSVPTDFLKDQYCRYLSQLARGKADLVNPTLLMEKVKFGHRWFLRAQEKLTMRHIGNC